MRANDRATRAASAAVTPLTMGVVVALTALTAGMAPAAADPRSDPSAPGTTVVEVPEPRSAPEPQVEQPRRQAEAPQVPVEVSQPRVEAPQPIEVPQPQVQAPVEVPKPQVEVPQPVEEPQPRVDAPKPRVQAPQPAVSTPQVEGPSVTDAPEPSSVTPTSKPRPAAPDPTTPEVPTSRSVSSPTVSAPAPATPEEPGPTTSVERKPTTSAEPGPGLPSVGVTPAAPRAQDTPPAVEDPSAPDAEPGAPVAGTSSRAPVETSVAEAARQLPTELPQTLEAAQDDVQVAMTAKVVESEPLPAKTDDVAEFASALGLPGPDRRDEPRPADQKPFGQSDRHDDRDGGDDRWDDDHWEDRRDGRDWDRRVKQWDPDWVRYDEYYRPVLCNPYRQPVRIVYVYQNTPRIVVINPLQRVVLNVAEYAAYSFTAVVANAVNTAVNTAANVAVGSFFGGGYYPGYGLPLPPPPPPVLRYDNVPVQVRYPQAVYQPFRVQRIVDVGPDARYGEHKVLLDGVTPAWGEWTQNAAGERQFEIHKTQQFPGLEEPSAGPLPGDYRLRLAADENDGMDPKSIYLVVVAGVLAAMSLGAVGWSVLLGRRNRATH